MIYMEDVTGYRVGDKEFQRGMSLTDERGITYIDQAYHAAWNESQATGLPIVTLGEDQADKVARLAAAAAERAAAAAERKAAKEAR